MTGLSSDAAPTVTADDTSEGGERFYAVTLLADESGELAFGLQTSWTGYVDGGHRVEVREGRLLSIRFAETWDSIGEPYSIVRTDAELGPFYLVGGHALIERGVAERNMPRLISPQPSYPKGARGFVSEAFLETAALRRATTQKLRMKVIERDGYRCRICGRRPDDDVDLMLHVHHIRPWANGGLTEMANLITLCHACHGGLDPHFMPALFDYLDKGQPSIKERRDAEMENYRRFVVGTVEAFVADEANSG